jgi:hypothetical protein
MALPVMSRVNRVCEVVVEYVTRNSPYKGGYLVEIPMAVEQQTIDSSEISVALTLSLGVNGAVRWDCMSHTVRAVSEERGPNLALETDHEVPWKFRPFQFWYSWAAAEGEGVKAWIMAEPAARSSPDPRGTFALVVTPPDQKGKRAFLSFTRHVVFVLDRSASMLGGVWAEVVAAVARALESLEPGDSFSIVLFAKEIEVFEMAKVKQKRSEVAVGKGSLASRSYGSSSDSASSSGSSTSSSSSGSRSSSSSSSRTQPYQQQQQLSRRSVAPTPGKMTGAPLAAPVAAAPEKAAPVKTISLTAASPAAVRAASDWLLSSRVAGGGSTDHKVAMSAALSLLARHNDANHVASTVYLVTDGSSEEEREIIHAVRRAEPHVRVHALGIGPFCNSFFLTSLAVAGRGSSRLVLEESQLPRALEEMFSLTSRPVLKNLTLKVTGVDSFELCPFPIPDLDANAPVIVYGKFFGRFPDAVVVTGTGVSGTFSTVLPSQLVPDVAIHRLSIVPRLDLLNAKAWLFNDRSVHLHAKSKGVRYKINTVHTPMVVFESSPSAHEGIIRRRPRTHAGVILANLVGQVVVQGPAHNGFGSVARTAANDRPFGPASASAATSSSASALGKEAPDGSDVPIYGPGGAVLKLDPPGPDCCGFFCGSDPSAVENLAVLHTCVVSEEVVACFAPISTTCDALTAGSCTAAGQLFHDCLTCASGPVDRGAVTAADGKAPLCSGCCKMFKRAPSGCAKGFRNVPDLLQGVGIVCSAIFRGRWFNSRGGCELLEGCLL